MNADDMLADIISALKLELGTGFKKIAKFVEQQGKLLAKQAELIARSRINGPLANDDEFYQWLLKGLEKDTANMAKGVAVLTALTIERAWNAIANVVWGGLSAILTASGVPAPLIPAKPPKI